MDKFIGIWWSGGEDDARGGGAEAKGYLTLNFNGVGTNYPAIQDIEKHVVDKSKSQVRRTRSARTSTTAASTTPRGGGPTRKVI